MAAAYAFNRSRATYIVKVCKTGRGHQIVSKREFSDYDAAMEHLDRMEAIYGPNYIVEFDTHWN